MTTTQQSRLTAVSIVLTGRVHGVGMRPAIVRLARLHNVKGYVRNCSSGVEILAEGYAEAVTAFEKTLRCRTDAPFGGIRCIRSVESVPIDAADFVVDESRSGNNIGVDAPVDLAICQECLAELHDSANRRANHSFVSCVNCGPRYSILERLPFDRQATTMAEFEPCSDCNAEYRNIDDRRFHSQVHACPNCGPQLYFIGDGKASSTPINAAAEVIRHGGIVCVKGLGGYQLVCDATSTDAVCELRKRKHRASKPFAVMVADIAHAREIAVVDETSETILQSSRNPIVLLPTRPSFIVEDVAPNLSTIGVMLPTTAVHHRLLRSVDRPCVVTSYNQVDAPIQYENITAGVSNAFDALLDHDRDILRPVDDSVVKPISGGHCVIRAARGFAPQTLNLPLTNRSVLAVGGHQKVALALKAPSLAVFGPYIGDMNSVASRERFTSQVESFTDLCQTSPNVVAHDMHPDYFTTRWASESGKRTIAVQHHHAHAVSAMVEHGWLDREVLGVVFDGTGYGPDGTIWGGEMLRCTARSFTRVARLKPFTLPNFERAIRNPSQVAKVLVDEAAGRSGPRSRTSGIPTSSMGRLFDGVASLVLGIDFVTYEGEAAIRLESICEDRAVTPYSIPIIQGDVAELDWRPLILDIVADRQHGVSPGLIGTKFVQAIARSVAEVCRSHSLPIVLSGGCFQNSVLTRFVVEEPGLLDREVGVPGSIPPNDGGLAVGQLAVAQAVLSAEGGK